MLPHFPVFCIVEDVDGFEAFSAACNALLDPSLAIAFTPIDDSQVSLSPVDIHQHIGAACMLGFDVPIMVQCSLGVQFVGVAGHELKKLLWDVQPPFSHKQCSHMSTKSMQL